MKLKNSRVSPSLWRWRTTLNCEMLRLSATHRICCYDLNYALGIHSFRPIWPCLIVKLIATWAKFLKPSGCCILLSCTFTLHTTNVFGCFHSIMAQFELVKHQVEGDQRAPFSIATTARCRGGHYSFPWIAPLYPQYIPYIEVPVV